MHKDLQMIAIPISISQLQPISFLYFRPQKGMVMVLYIIISKDEESHG